METRDVKVGQRVVHEQFGSGKVVSRISRFVVVDFEGQNCALAVLPAGLRAKRSMWHTFWRHRWTAQLRALWRRSIRRLAQARASWPRDDGRLAASTIGG